MNRREFTASAGMTIVSVISGRKPSEKGETSMYGIIGKMIAQDGKRDEIIAIMLDGARDMPGCISYVVAKDSTDGNALWITEVWESQDSHSASLSLDAVQQAIAKGRPLIAGFAERFETEPVGLHGTS